MHQNQSILRGGSLHRRPAEPGRLCRNVGVASAPSSAIVGTALGGSCLAVGRRCPARCPSLLCPASHPLCLRHLERDWAPSAARARCWIRPGWLLPLLAQERCGWEPLLNPGLYQLLKQRGSGGCISLCHGSGPFCRASAPGRGSRWWGGFSFQCIPSTFQPPALPYQPDVLAGSWRMVGEPTGRSISFPSDATPPLPPCPAQPSPPPPGTEQPPPQPSHLPEGLLQLEVEHTLLHHRLLHLPATSILPCCSSTTVPRLAPQIQGGPVPATHPCPTAALPSHRVVSSQHVTCGRVLLFPTLNPTRASASCVCELTIKGSWRHNPGRAGRTPTLTHDASYRTPAASPDAGQPCRRQPLAVPQFPHL